MNIIYLIKIIYNKQTKNIRYIFLTKKYLKSIISIIYYFLSTFIRLGGR